MKHIRNITLLGHRCVISFEDPKNRVIDTDKISITIINDTPVTFSDLSEGDKKKVLKFINKTTNGTKHF